MAEALPKLQVRFEEQDQSDAQFDEIRTIHGEIEEIIDPLETNFKKFKNFDFVDYPPYDHYFFNKKPKEDINKLSTLSKMIKIEWEILRLLLPNSIYVRAYELRPDLMRAIIVAPKGTPYSHGLFCFDICFPENYPIQSPKLFFHSYGYSLNPNLNKNGKVSMPTISKSTQERLKIYQILFNIQNTVLDIKADRYKEEDVFMLTSKIMLCMLKSPPRNFEDFVRGYFRTRAHHILLNYKSHMGSDEKSRILFFTLIRAFEANGTYCKHHYNDKECKRELEKAGENLYDMKPMSLT